MSGGRPCTGEPYRKDTIFEPAVQDWMGIISASQTLSSMSMVTEIIVFGFENGSGSESDSFSKQSLYRVQHLISKALCWVSYRSSPIYFMMLLSFHTSCYFHFTLANTGLLLEFLNDMGNVRGKFSMGKSGVSCSFTRSWPPWTKPQNPITQNPIEWTWRRKLDMKNDKP